MEQKISRQILLAVILMLAAACRKTEIRTDGTASLSIINAIPGTSSLVTNFSGTAPLSNYYLNARQIAYNTFTQDYQFSSYSGNVRLALFNFPDTLAKSKPVVDLTLNLQIGSIYSLFVTGSIAQPDTLFTTDHPPYYAASDSITGIRFINLSPGSAPVSVNLAGQPDGSEINSLPYKSVTGFMRYPATDNISSYTFEFRDKASGRLLGSYEATGINNNSATPDNPINKWRFRNCTLALLGLPDDGSGNGTQSILLINNY